MNKISLSLLLAGLFLVLSQSCQMNKKPKIAADDSLGLVVWMQSVSDCHEQTAKNIA